MFTLVNLFFWAMPGSKVVASIYLITVDVGLELGYCRADAWLLLNGCGRSPQAACKTGSLPTAAELLPGCF